MTPSDAVAAAERAANATCRAGQKEGGFLQAIGAGGRLDDAAAFVRRFPEAPAEALYLELSRRAGEVSWASLEARKRAAVEVFRATLAICDRLVAAEAAPPETRKPDLSRLERSIERSPSLGTRIWD